MNLMNRLRKSVTCRNVLLALILITLALPFYGLFLMISGIINACRDKRIKEEIARLSSFRG